MPVLEEIAAFFSVQSEWQRRAYAELRSGREFSELLVTELTELCIEEVTEKRAATNANAAEALSQKAVDAVPVVQLLAIENVKNINNLAPQQSLKLAASGLTIVYGDNGAGKSGYSRIVRQVCQARGVAPVLRGNVFLDAQTQGSADIIFAENGVATKISIGVGTVSNGPMRHFSVFDSGAATTLVNEQNATAFRPFGLDLLDRFTVVADAVKERIDRELIESATPLVNANDYPENTSAGRLVRGLHVGSTRRGLSSKIIALTSEQERRREELRTVLLQARANDPAKLAQGINAKAARYQQLLQRLNTVASAFEGGKITAFCSLRRETTEAELAAEVARTKAFLGESLKEVGAATWRRLWEVAREYSAVAGAGKSIAEANIGDRCVLCAQPLSGEAAARMQTLESFVKGELQAKASQLRKRLDVDLSNFANLPLQNSGDDALMQELATDDVTAASEVEKFLTQCREILGKLHEHYETGTAIVQDEISITLPSTLSALPGLLRERALELQKAASAHTLAQQQADLGELDAQAKLFQEGETVEREAARLARRTELEKAKRTTSTRSVSELSKELTGKYVSDALCERFKQEIHKLGLQHLEVELTSSGAQKGKLFHRLFLKSKQEAPLREVLSEGEFRCLALAAFLAEAGGTTSGILFDDPVSSLDHAWRGRIAQRLAQESKVRQVVVFTHDIVFHFLLKEAGESPSLNTSLKECCLERRGKAGAGYCREDAPWAGMKIKSRIGLLKNDLVVLKKQYDQGDENYERHIRDWYGRLRESWERAIEECLLNDAVRRFRHSVETNRLEKALTRIQPGDWPAIEKGMTRASAVIRGHDGAEELNPPIPTPEEATRDMQEFENWVKTKN